MPTFGDTSQLSEQEQAQLDSALVGYEAFLQSLDPAQRQLQEQRDREALAELDQEPEDSGPEATPLARQEAQDNGVDLADVEGTGEDGRITVEDVREHIRNEGGNE